MSPTSSWHVRAAAAAVLLASACGTGISTSPTDASVVPDAQIFDDLEELVEAYEAEQITRDEFRAALARFDDSDAPASLTDITETTLLKARTEPYRVPADLTVAAGAILVIAPGVELIVEEGASVRVQGRLYAVGSTDATIALRSEGDTHWGALTLESGPNQVVWAEFDRPTQGLVVAHPFEVRTLIESTRFDSWADVAVYQKESSNLRIVRSSFGYETAQDDIAGEAIRSYRAGALFIQGSSFGYRRGYQDVIDLQECLEGYWPQIIGNRFDGGEDDAIDLDACSAFVVGNAIRNFHPEDWEQAQEGANGGGITGDQVGSRPFIANNLIDNCYHGIGFKNGAQPTIVNNTITNNNVGITLYQSAEGQPLAHGIVINNILANNVSWSTGAPQEILLTGRWWPQYNQDDDVQGTVDARFNITASLPEPYDGVQNLNDDPLLQLVDEVPVPRAGSPALDSGLGALSFPALPEALVRELLKVDYLGKVRNFDDGVYYGIDRGAVERQD